MADDSEQAQLRRAIDAARAAVAAALAQNFPGTPGVTPHSFFDEAPATWQLDGDRLRWHVVLVGVAADAIEIDQLDDAFLVRARCATAATGWLGAVLPVPRGFDKELARAHFHGSLLALELAAIDRALPLDE